MSETSAQTHRFLLLQLGRLLSLGPLLFSLYSSVLFLLSGSRGSGGRVFLLSSRSSESDRSESNGLNRSGRNEGKEMGFELILQGLSGVSIETPGQSSSQANGSHKLRWIQLTLLFRTSTATFPTNTVRLSRSTELSPSGTYFVFFTLRFFLSALPASTSTVISAASS